MRTVVAPSIDADGRVLTPSARTVSLRCERALFIRSWPVAIAVTQEGRTSRVRIIDMTRLIQAAIVLGVVACTCGLRARARARKEKRS
jgi:hypothetical protein